jgi:nicotinamide mononucleotide transporter
MELNTMLEIAAVVLALVYVMLAAKESIWCWLPAFASSTIYAWLTWTAGLVGETAISVFYMAMAVYGWLKWTNAGTQDELPITEWKTSVHGFVLMAGTAVGLLMGTAFDHLFGSQMPYLDALTTVFSLIATFMVTRKVLSNWLYWVGIDALNVYLYWNRDLQLSSLLYLLYTVLAVWGFIQWKNTWERQHSS